MRRVQFDGEICKCCSRGRSTAGGGGGAVGLHGVQSPGPEEVLLLTSTRVQLTFFLGLERTCRCQIRLAQPNGWLRALCLEMNPQNLSSL
ncbi:hypothetical protein NL676_020597 [Syzygium grande]|nr:hypothetical protein NL676_020597 [Syzygium grande]